jgi:hypothetical protein
VINPDTNKLHRVSFSKSLVDHIVKHHFTRYKVVTARYIRGKKLSPGETSKGLYGIIASKKDIILRCPIRKELAEIYANDDSRHIEEIFLRFN